MRGVPRERRAISTRGVVLDRDAEDVGGAADDDGERVDVVEVEAVHDAEARAQRRGEQTRARRRADEREARQLELQRARRRTLSDHDVDVKVLHRRVEHLLDDRRQAMDLVDEQHVAGFEVRDDGREIARLLERRAGGRAQARVHFVGDDVRERGLAEAGRAEEQHVIERLAPFARRGQRDLEILFDLVLADVLAQEPRAERELGLEVFRVGVGARMRSSTAGV